IVARATHLLLRPRELNYETAMLGLFGKSLYYFLLYPYTKKTWCVEPNRLSADIVHTRITATPGKFIRRLFRRQRSSKSTLAYDTTVSEFLYTDGGIQTLADAFAEYILRHRGEIICQAEVTKINPGDKLQCYFRTPSFSSTSSTKVINADYIINTLPLTDFMGMLSDSPMPSSVKKSVESLNYLAMILVFIVVKKPRLSADSWLYFPEETIPINRAYETKNFQHTLGPPDKTLLCCEITCFRNDKTWNLPDNVIAKQVVEALLPCALFTASQVMETSVFRLTHAYPVYELNYNAHLQIIWEYLKQFPRLLTAGRQGLFHHNNMDHCLYEGFKVAECLVNQPENPAAFWYPSLKQFFRLRIID
ncbi:MAG: FAD-dependent oxidoreductase, partial [Candidatus Sumerlaeia bacterium]|nr:FAD-dependent oxidoreductase [Candidatus Sumerlaeia bacterium]